MYKNLYKEFSVVDIFVSYFMIKFLIKNCREMAQQLGALTAFPEDSSSIPRTDMPAHSCL